MQLKSQNSSYGLLDVEQNFFYVVDPQKNIIADLVDLMLPYRTVVLITLHKCNEWFDNKIDNTICHTWGLNVFDSQLRLDGIKSGYLFLINNRVEITAESKILIKNLQEISKQLVSLDNTISNARSIIDCTYFDVAEHFANDVWIQKACNIEQQLFERKKLEILTFREKFKEHIKQGDMTSQHFIENLNQSVQSGRSLDQIIMHIATNSANDYSQIYD